MPGWPLTIWRGVCCRCPHCGRAPIFNGYLRVYKTCTSCAAPLGDMPADDAPPYIAMVAVLHVLAVFVIGSFQFGFFPNLWQALLLLLLLSGISMGALRLAKGAVIGILLKLGMKREPLNG